MKKNIFIAILFISNICLAQKKTINHSVYDTWEAIEEKHISNNGNWVGYNVLLQEGDGKIKLNNLLTNQQIEIQRGDNLQFSQDSKFSFCKIKPLFKETRNEKIKKTKEKDKIKDSLAIINLSDNSVLKVARVKSFQIPKKGESILVYQLENVIDSLDKKENKNSGDLIVKNLTKNTELTFKYISDYLLSENGKQLIFTCVGNKKDSKTQAGVFLLDTETGKIKNLVKQKGNYNNFAFSESNEYFAFMGEQDDEKKENKNYKIYYSSLNIDTAQILIENDMQGMPQKWNISKNQKISFSKDAKLLFFGIAPIREPKDTTLVDIDNAKLDIWGYKDDFLQPKQLKNLDKDLKKDYLACFDLLSIDPKIIPLADETTYDTKIINKGNSNYILTSSDIDSRIESQWTGTNVLDYFLVDVKTGQKKKIITKLNGNVYPSPNGEYIVYYDKKTRNWYNYEIKTEQINQLNLGLKVAFHHEDNDVPDYPSAYGLATWLEDDKGVFVYDKYDIWLFSTNPKVEPKNITNGLGRQLSISFRYENLTPEDDFIKNKDVILLNATNKITKDAGFYRKKLNDDKNPELLSISASKYTKIKKARDIAQFIYEKESFTNSPNVYATSDFKTEKQISNTNPQQQDYNWGTAELVRWTTYKGLQSEGILYKPENFDPNKKYPMIVYFYEKLSDGLNTYIPPAPTPSRLNISYFVSNGYLVFAPDIRYEIGFPGKSAIEYINSGVDMLKKKSWVDGNHIGIQGQSWGGYQVAYLITQTDMYAAAWAGAPVANMTSAYGGIRWETGVNRQFQYEKTQSRIGATLWEKPELYIQNSPLFYLPKVNTPLVIMSNDADGAVPWYQGIELFTGLKRLGKPSWLLNYNNEAHNLTQRQNKKDIQIRQQQFFDYYLKGAKAPLWMTSGIPAKEKGRKWGFELTDEKP